MTVCPAIFDCDVAALCIARLTEALAKGRNGVRQRVSGLEIEEPTHRHRRLLRTRLDWPRRGAAKSRNERPAVHSITSSARASSVDGMSSPSALAALRLIISSYLTGSSIGKSPGFAPRKIFA